MAGIMDDDTNDEDKGELKYQESKEFESEWFLCSAYDNPNSKRVTFEIYGLDTQDMFHKVWDYSAFDGLFRFNAELMNPNRKEGRFHWIIERLQIVTLSGTRELRLSPEPTEEVPQLPLYETTRKIPTGRMDLKERQRLREQMDMLDIRRAENIAKKRQATKQRVLAHIMRLKEEDALRKKEVNRKIEEEKKLRVRMKEEAEKREREEEARREVMRKQRGKKVEEQETNILGRDEEKYKALRVRWRELDAERAKLLADLRDRAEREKQAKIDAEVNRKAHFEDVGKRRQAAWKAREERVRKKEKAKINAILEVKETRARQAKLRLERNKEFLSLLHSERQPIFREQLDRTEERKKAKESEREALENYKEKRALPKKVNKKGGKRSSSRPMGATSDKAAQARPDVTSPKPKGKSKAKGKSKDESETEAGEPSDVGEAKPTVGRIDPDKVLDAVEAKMRKEMEEARKREIKQRKREKKIQERDAAREVKENEHMAKVRETYRRDHTVKEEAAAQRRVVMAQREKDAATAEARKQQERARLEKVREQNMARKEKMRFEHMCAATAH